MPISGQNSAIDKDNTSITELSKNLLGVDDETSQQRIGKLILEKYEQLEEDEKKAFFQFLTDEMDLDSHAILSHVKDYQHHRDADSLSKLLDASEPLRQDFLRRLNQVAGATEVLVNMRADLLRFAAQDKHLKIADLDFAHLFTSWFNRGFLTLQPISWHTPANILAKIIKYEAVHAINDWDDLRSRLQPEDRRCFAFFHPAMPDEPLVFVEVALCKGMPNSIQSVLDERDENLMCDEIDTAAFYSISNCQRGLSGVSFETPLSSRLYQIWQRKFHLKHFVTLSPLPGFAKWLQDHKEHLSQNIIDQIEQAEASVLETSDYSPLDKHSGVLKSLAAQYLLEAKRPDGQPVDAVARFHPETGHLYMRFMQVQISR